MPSDNPRQGSLRKHNTTHEIKVGMGRKGKAQHPCMACRLIVVHQCGHCIHLERPKEIVEGLKDFIPELRGAPWTGKSPVRESAAVPKAGL